MGVKIKLHSKTTTTTKKERTDFHNNNSRLNLHFIHFHFLDYLYKKL